MKKILLMGLALVLVTVLAGGGTLAYLMDTDSAVNVMTLGEVKIQQLEKDRSGADFIQNQPVVPAVTDSLQAWVPDTPVKLADGMWINMWGNHVNNDIDKIVTVKNTGKSPAYIRTIIAVESFDENDWHVSDMMAGYYATEADALAKTNRIQTMAGNAWELIGNTDIGGANYYVLAATYKDALKAGAVSAPSLTGAALDDAVTSQHAEKYGDTWQILVLTQAVQAENFSGPEEALNAGFGEVTTDAAAEWFEVMLAPDTPGNSDELKDAIDDAKPGDTIVLPDGDYQLPEDIGKDNITISGSGRTTIEIPRALADGSTLYTISGENVTLKNLDFVLAGSSGTAPAAYPLEITGSGALIENCSFDCIGTNYCIMKVESSDAVIRNCDFTGGEKAIGGSKSTGHVLMEGCTFSGCDWAADFIGGTGTVTMKDCTIDADRCGFASTLAKVTLQENTITTAITVCCDMDSIGNTFTGNNKYPTGFYESNETYTLTSAGDIWNGIRPLYEKGPNATVVIK